MQPEVAIVGGGITGTVAATTLARLLPGARITLFDQGRGLGGRASHRRVDDGEVVAPWARASMAFDHVGCIGNPVRRVTRRRSLGVALMVLGSALSVAHELTEEISHTRQAARLLAGSIFPLVGGALLPVQAAVNGQLAKALGAPLRATLVSFIGGTLCLAMAVGACGTPPRASQRARVSQPVERFEAVPASSDNKLRRGEPSSSAPAAVGGGRGGPMRRKTSKSQRR